MTIQLEPSAGRREWLGLAVLALPTLLLSLDVSVLYLALPQLSADLGAESTEQLWILDIYGFMIAGFLVTMGTLGDRVGRRRLLLIGAAAFGATSVLAAFAASPGTLIAARAVLGIAGATLMPSTLALIRNMFHHSGQRALAIAVWMSCFMVGAATGPLIGGLLLAAFWWGSVFLLGVPVMALLLVTAPVLLPEHRDPAPGRLDLPSVALSLAAILPVIYGLKEVAKDGAQPLPVAAILVGAAFGVAFVRRQRRLPAPLLDLRLFANRSFTAALTIGLVTGVVMGGTFLLVTLYLQQVLGLSALHAGLCQLPQAIAMIIGSMLAPGIAARFGQVRVMATGLVIAATGLLLLARVDPDHGLLAALAGLVLVSIGLGPVMALGTGLVLGAAPPEKAGSASSMSETSGEFGIALGVAALGSLGATVYRADLVAAIPAGVPSGAAGVAGEGLAGAAAIAGQLPEGLGAGLLEAARGAFTLGLNVTAAAGAVLFAALAVLTTGLLRRARPTGGHEIEQPAPEPHAVPV